MNLVFAGTFWALVIFHGPMQIEGTIYLHQASCQKALYQEIDRPHCAPAPGKTFCITGIPKMRCVKMKAGPDQAIRKIQRQRAKR